MMKEPCKASRILIFIKNGNKNNLLFIYSANMKRAALKWYALY